jgi:AcrR family transcriptional regulator
LNRCLYRRNIFGVSDLDSTRARLVIAAERLFAEEGEEATSVRSVTRAAMSNAAAVHYHFGGRDGLLRAVLERHLGVRHDRRLRLLDRATEQYGEQVPVVVALTAVVRPDLELIGKLRKHRVLVARFLGRAFTIPSPIVADYLDREFLVLADRVLPMLVAALPDVSVADVRLRLRLVLDALAMLYATAPDPGQPGPLGTDDVDEQVRRLVAFAAGGIGAPVPAAAGDVTPEKSRKRRKRS